jgi:para-aminobenzoate synthetase / 4-amino-4-deoxychorismate lyase
VAGDGYEVNLTSKVRFNFSGSPAALFARVRDRQRVPYSAFLHFDRWNILILTCPMKGTAPRRRTLAEDMRGQAWLQHDPKNRSENVMIVDLLRNDLGRISETGSMRVDDPFVTEKYATLFQMTSRVSGTLRQDTALCESLGAMFPSGSVTGAPKVRTMQIIQELESAARDEYTGTIGYFGPNGEAVFNVAIRTIVLNGTAAR